MIPGHRALALVLISLLMVSYSLVTVLKTSSSAIVTKGQNVQLYEQLVELETPRDEQAVRDLLRDSDFEAGPLQREQYRVTVGLDRGFLFLYPLQLLALIGFAWREDINCIAKRWLILSAMTILAAAFCGYVENRQISHLLTDISQQLVNEARWWSLGKWTLSGIGYFSAGAALSTYIKGPPSESELEPQGPWRLRIIIVALLLDGICSTWGATSFVWNGDFRFLFKISASLTTIAVIACATFWPLRFLKKTRDSRPRGHPIPEAGCQY